MISMKRMIGGVVGGGGISEKGGNDISHGAIEQQKKLTVSKSEIAVASRR